MRKGNGMEVVAQLLDIGTGSDSVVAWLRMEQVPAPPLAPAGLYRMNDPVDPVLELHRLRSEEGSALVFENFDRDPGRDLPSAGDRYLFRPWWALHQFDVVKDTSRRWVKRAFVPDPPHDNVSMTPGSDHRHCVLCWSSISPEPPDDPEGYTDGSVWLCRACHDRYVSRDVLRLRRAGTRS